jgi:tetratricopeptide (TPR) repeat protein
MNKELVLDEIVPGFRDKFQRQVDFYFSRAGRHKRLENALSQANAPELLQLAQNRKIQAMEFTEPIAEETACLLERAIDLGFGSDMKTASRASQLLLEAYELIGQPERALPYQKKCIELLKLWLDGGAPFDFNQRSDVCGLIAATWEDLGDEEQAANYRQLQLENRDGFTLLRAAEEKLRNHGKEISKEDGARILDALTKAAERLPQKYFEQHAEIYRATGDILAAWGDDQQAITYFEAALKTNPKIAVKRRLDKLHARANRGGGPSLTELQENGGLK